MGALHHPYFAKPQGGRRGGWKSAQIARIWQDKFGLQFLNVRMGAVFSLVPDAAASVSSKWQVTHRSPCVVYGFTCCVFGFARLECSSVNKKTVRISPNRYTRSRHSPDLVK